MNTRDSTANALPPPAAAPGNDPSGAQEALVPHIDLETLAGKARYQQVCQLEALEPVTRTLLRGQELFFLTPTKRLLWQALGQEYIEPDQLDYIDSMPEGSVYYDIGASNGLFALYAAATGKQVYCFEAETSNFALLNHNSYLNSRQQPARMRNFNIALSDKTELGDIFIKVFEPGGHLKIIDTPVQRGQTAFTPEFIQAVLKFRLDEFIEITRIPPPNHIKIDVDGSELQVISGMQALLNNRALQKIFIELEENNSNSQACRQRILENGFIEQSKRRVQNYFGENNVIFSRPG